MRHFLAKVSVLVFLSAKPLYAYDPVTHEHISRSAASKSVLSNVLSIDLGLDVNREYSDGEGNKGIPAELVGIGAILEDDNTRPLNHFFNPISGLGLWNVGWPSPSWALEDDGDIPGGRAQLLSYRDGRRYFYKALTEQAFSGRDRNLALTFRTLGHAMHHLQDMAQPQHVRNDAHLDKLSLTVNGAQLNPLYRPSAYEKYTKERGKIIPMDGYDAVYAPGQRGSFARPRDFWTDGNGALGSGLAQFTNSNFVSAGTNFEYDADDNVVTNPGFALPQPFGPAWDSVVSEMTQDFNAAQLANFWSSCEGQGRVCVMSFFPSVVQDRLTGQTSINKYASTASIFDQDLQELGTPVSYTDPITNVTYTTGRLFALNQVNFRHANAYLLPRAASYSTGLINYFFRGKLGFELDSSTNTPQYIIKNLGGETIQGEFQLYYDDKNGNRHPITGAKWNSSIAPGGQLRNITIPAPADDAVSAKTLGEYMLVFKGTIGSETEDADAGEPGGVIGKLVRDPAVVKFRKCYGNNGYWLQGDGSYKVDNITGAIWLCDIERNASLEKAFNARSHFRVFVNGVESGPCKRYSGSVICNRPDAQNCADPVSHFEVEFDPIGSSNLYGTPYFDVLCFPVGEAEIKITADDVPLFSFKLTPQNSGMNSPMILTKLFRANYTNVAGVIVGP